MAPFVGWSVRNRCVKPTRWVLFHWGEVRIRMGLWLQNLIQANFGTFRDPKRSTDIVASPHGAQLTNMLFMDRKISVMEFFPKGWLELAGVGQYAHHWMADQSGMKHWGAWWDPLGDVECPFPQQDPRCFIFYKDCKISRNETFFAEWARNVLNQVWISKLEQAAKSSATKPHPNSNAWVC